MAQLNTKIVLRNDSTAAWADVAESDSHKLLKGEVGIEFTGNGTPKMKIGDGVHTWADLGYVGGAQANVFEVIPSEGQSHNDALLIATHGKTLNVGDIAYVKEAIYIDTTNGVNNKYSYTGYVWNGSAWAAMDGNYSADNVYFDEDMMVTTNIGYITTTDGSGTIPSAGKNLTQVFEAMFVKEMEPDNNTDPSVSFTSVTTGSKEVGTKVTPSFNAKFDAGTYEYGPETGVELEATATSETGWTVTAKNGSTIVDTKYTNSGSFAEFVVDDDTNYTIIATANHTTGNTPNTNKQVPSTTVAAFAAGTKSKTSSAISGYRSYFYGAVTKDPSELTSADIRALTNGGNYNGSKTGLEIKANGATNVKAFVIAIPGTNTRSGVTKVESTAGMTVEVTSQYELSSTIKPQVADCRGTNNDGTLNNSKEYKLWIWKPSEVDPGTVHKINLG